jgi:hypothetical protein
MSKTAWTVEIPLDTEDPAKVKVDLYWRGMFAGSLRIDRAAVLDLRERLGFTRTRLCEWCTTPTPTSDLATITVGLTKKRSFEVCKLCFNAITERQHKSNARQEADSEPSG